MLSLHHFLRETNDHKEDDCWDESVVETNVYLWAAVVELLKDDEPPGQHDEHQVWDPQSVVYICSLRDDQSMEILLSETLDADDESYHFKEKKVTNNNEEIHVHFADDIAADFKI